MDIQNNSIVTDADTEVLDSQITQISNDFAENYYLDNEQEEELELLIAKAMKLGELYERKKWQAAKAQAVPDTYTPIVLALEDVQSKIAKTSFLTMDEENENEVMAVNANELAAYIDELIEAQEST
ncbi:hypothetical protein WCE12_09080 [Acinetobacter radioresistens]|uniref:hypothetical protein n=1 Tax=Acinetobacter radioresistens TaxID=40216 RepID=UPI0034D45BB8